MGAGFGVDGAGAMSGCEGAGGLEGGTDFAREGVDIFIGEGGRDVDTPLLVGDADTPGSSVRARLYSLPLSRSTSTARFSSSAPPDDGRFLPALFLADITIASFVSNIASFIVAAFR
ncbi:hypothetical protein NEOLEDRAFT_1136361 [Neolentinus lepideus HHB14362 ss-1]|uniref:Uncharacterized protein n=1 Tax=Neolentinus lepideus HHB14362 ss-1 TaxID=1314782 RepID=A0A165RBK8_9AGAM|nr:hypothetical protein NEOLEDRAFT_1136361 [Neolentinus lepideus HHB14362 ss-1]